jgi:hypothetical protein
VHGRAIVLTSPSDLFPDSLVTEFALADELGVPIIVYGEISDKKEHHIDNRSSSARHEILNRCIGLISGSLSVDNLDLPSVRRGLLLSALYKSTAVGFGRSYRNDSK